MFLHVCVLHVTIWNLQNVEKGLSILQKNKIFAKMAHTTFLQWHNELLLLIAFISNFSNGLFFITDIETLVVSQSGHTLTVSWPAIVSDFDLYEVHHSPDNGYEPSSLFTAFTSQRVVRLTGLTSGQQYTIVLNTVSVDGERTLIAKTCFTLRKFSFYYE